jgi:hypothetical protein
VAQPDYLQPHSGGDDATMRRLQQLINKQQLERRQASPPDLMRTLMGPGPL